MPPLGDGDIASAKAGEPYPDEHRRETGQQQQRLYPRADQRLATAPPRDVLSQPVSPRCRRIVLTGKLWT